MSFQPIDTNLAGPITDVSKPKAEETEKEKKYELAKQNPDSWGGKLSNAANVVKNALFGNLLLGGNNNGVKQAPPKPAIVIVNEILEDSPEAKLDQYNKMGLSIVKMNSQKYDAASEFMDSFDAQMKLSGLSLSLEAREMAKIYIAMSAIPIVALSSLGNLMSSLKTAGAKSFAASMFGNLAKYLISWAAKVAKTNPKLAHNVSRIVSGANKNTGTHADAHDKTHNISQPAHKHLDTGAVHTGHIHTVPQTQKVTQTKGDHTHQDVVSESQDVDEPTSAVVHTEDVDSSTAAQQISHAKQDHDHNDSGPKEGFLVYDKDGKLADVVYVSSYAADEILGHDHGAHADAIDFATRELNNTVDDLVGAAENADKDAKAKYKQAQSEEADKRNLRTEADKRDYSLTQMTKDQRLARQASDKAITANLRNLGTV